ncbi:hypothetical protein ACQCX2_15660 [Propionibacteriaceae bacterium Y1700]|uniref:hypothetical protein n=1 Tax=Microlunatus sp. Y1700 TaxID=3418487 RepID=UPI003DA6FF81
MDSDHFGLGDLEPLDGDDLGPLDQSDTEAGAPPSATPDNPSPPPAAVSPSNGATLDLPPVFSADPPTPVTVHIEWSNDRPLAVTVDPNWRTHSGPEAMLRAVREAVNSHGEIRTSWLAGVSTRDVPLEQLAEFNALLTEALKEEDLEPHGHRRIEHDHITSVWLDGSLMAIECEPDWLARVPHERLEDELVTVCMAPAPVEHSITARHRFTTFLEKLT